MSGQEGRILPLRLLNGWDYHLFAELIYLCWVFQELQHKSIISPHEDIPPCPERFTWASEGYLLLKKQSDDWFAEIGLLEPAVNFHANEKENATPNLSHDSSSANTFTSNKSSFDGSKTASSRTDTTHAEDDNADAAAAVNDNGSDWLTASSVASNSSSSSATQVHSTTAFPSPAEQWRDIATNASALRVLYARNLPAGLSALPLYYWRTYDVLRAALVGVFRIFMRMKPFLLRVFDDGRWDGAWLWSLVYRAAVARGAEDVDGEGGRARTVAESILGRLLMLCCPWYELEKRRRWVEIVVGWICALIEHQMRLELENSASGGEGIGSETATEVESGESDVSDQAHGSDQG